MITTNPTLLAMPIAVNGTKNTIPATQAAAGDGLLSQSTGFPPETALPLGAGGKAPTREDFNGALNLLSDIAFYAQKGWFFQFDDTQAYFAGCVVRDTTDGVLYEAINDVAAGGDVPSSDSDNWKKFFPVGKTIGEIFPYAGTSQPPGALLCNGAAVSRTMYPDLFDEIGTKYGSGDGSTTFNLPNLLDAALMNGAYTKTKYETAGSATFTASKTGWYKITVKGAGGGGGGGLYTNLAAAGGFGGGEGGTTIAYEKMSAGQTASVVIGAGGAGGTKGTPAPGIGVDGGDTTITINTSVYVGGGGSGGGKAGGGIGGDGTIVGAAGNVSEYSTTSYMSFGGSGGGAGGGAYSVKGGRYGGGGAGGDAVVNSAASTTDGGKGGDGYAWIEYIGASEPYFIQAFNASTDPALVDLTQIAQDLANKLTREQTPAFNKVDVVTVSGTYTAPVTGWYRITVKGGGGGGNGARGSVTAVAGAGGGEGGTTIGYEKMTAGQTASVVVGAGGAGGAANLGPGGNGGNSTITVNSNTYTGGGGGGAGGGGNRGRGGTGDIPGACGNGGDTNYMPTSAGTMTMSGGSGGGSGAGQGGANAIGEDGTNGCGGGGGGCAAGNSSTQYAGGKGGDGYAWFEYFDPSLM